MQVNKEENREDLEEKFGKFGLPTVAPGANRGQIRKFIHSVASSPTSKRPGNRHIWR